MKMHFDEEVSASEHLSRLLVMMSVVVTFITILLALLDIVPWESKTTQENLFVSGVIGGIGILIYATVRKPSRKSPEANDTH